MLSLDELHKIYPNHPKQVELLHRKPKNDLDLIINFLPSKLWRLNNLYTITDVEGRPCKFVMSRAQHLVYSKILTHHRLNILKSRQQGISTLWLVSFFDDSLFNPHYNIGLMAMGRDNTTKLLERTKFMWECLNPGILSYLSNYYKTPFKITTDNRYEIGFSNNTNIYIRPSFRSGTLQRLHISELGKIANEKPKHAIETKSGSIQTIHKQSIIIIECTAEGDNMYKQMWDSAVVNYKASNYLGDKDFLPVFLAWQDDPNNVSNRKEEPTMDSSIYFDRKEKDDGIKFSDEQKNYWIMQHRILKDDIYKEYPATPEDAFWASMKGTYYNEFYTKYILNKERIKKGLYDPNLSVQAALDLGADDYTVIGYFQVYKKELRLIEEFVDRREDMNFYIDKIKNSGYDITRVILPHDAKTTEMTSGLSRSEQAINAGLPVYQLDKTNQADGIDLVRRMLKNMWIDPRCEYSIECLQKYSKDWDTRLQVWKDKPRHDDFSHGADMLRYYAWGAEDLWHNLDTDSEDYDGMDL